MRNFFLKTDRIGFSKWHSGDQEIAELLWGDSEVTKFICASGVFTQEDIINRLNTEIANDEKYQIQYWPIFELATDELIGCCGLRPHGIKVLQKLGFVYVSDEFYEPTGLYHPSYELINTTVQKGNI